MSLVSLIPFLMPLALLGVFLWSLPTGLEILRRGNDADPLGREIEEENAKKAERKAA